MKRKFRTFSLLLLSSLLAMSAIATAQSIEFTKQQQTYLNLCSQLDRPQVDCTCVAKAHATYAHLSPNQQYAEYLVESYKEKLGMPNKREQAFESYIGGRSAEAAQIEMFNAFDEFESSDPFYEEVNGCVIVEAAKVELAPLPSAPIYQEIYEYRVNSSGNHRFEQCVLAETQKVLSNDELAALHYVFYRGVNGDIIEKNLGISENEANTRARNASNKLKTYEANTRNLFGYCSALLVAEDNSTGETIARFARTGQQRAGAPLGLEAIDVSRPRGPITDNFGNQITQIKSDIASINKENESQPTIQEMKEDLQSNKAYQQAQAMNNAKPMSANESLLSNGCKNAGNSEAFCSCFVSAFIKELGEDAGAAALPIIADGISPAQSMALMKNINQGTYMQDMMKAQSISQRCE